MAIIIQRVFATDTKKGISLGNEEWVRGLTIGTNWSRLRIGILCAANPDGTNNINGCSYALGVCSGTSNPFGAASTANFIGGGRSAGVLTYTAGAGNPYYTVTSTTTLRRVGAITSTSGVGTLAFASTVGAVQRRWPFYVDVVKGSPNYTVLGYHYDQTTPATTFSINSFLDATEQVSAVPNLSGTLLATLLNSAVACDESTGVFDTVDFFWNKSLYPVEVYALAVARHA